MDLIFLGIIGYIFSDAMSSVASGAAAIASAKASEKVARHQAELAKSSVHGSRQNRADIP